MHMYLFVEIAYAYGDMSLFLEQVFDYQGVYTLFVRFSLQFQAKSV